jgi:hypothetical protein
MSFERHNRPVLGEVPKDLLGPLRIVQADCQADVATAYCGIRSRVVAHHDRRISNFDRAVHYVFRGTHIGHRRLTDGLSEQHFGTQRALVEFDRLPAIPSWSPGLTAN